MKKLISMLLASTAIMSNVYSVTFAENSDVVYTYENESGEIVNITQKQLDDEHWNKEALGDAAPILYEEFPMQIEGYVNDFGEISLSIDYMKKIEDMDSVTLKIIDISTGLTVYNEELSQYSFYSSNLEIGKQYEIQLLEVLDGETTGYAKGVSIDKVVSEINNHIDFTSSEENILIADIEDLKIGMTTNGNNQIVVDTSIAKYNSVEAKNFYNYIDVLPDNKVYRLYVNDNGKQYSGFISTNNRREIYNLEARVFNPIALCTDASVIAECDVLEFSSLRNITSIDLTDASFRKNDPSSVNSAYSVYEVSIPQNAINAYAKDEVDASFRVKVSGNTQVRVRSWFSLNSQVSYEGVRTSSNSSNSVSYTYYLSDYELSENDSIYLYYMVYFPTDGSGIGMINCTAREGYADDITGSVFEAYTDADAPDSRANTEFTITDSWDVDSFRICSETTGVYKVELRNRSLIAQSQLESGIYAEGSPAKTVTAWTYTDAGTSTRWSDYAVYSVPEGQDMVFYKRNNDSPEVISVRNQSLGDTDSNKYQLSYVLTPQEVANEL